LLDVMLRHSYASMTEETLAERADLNQSTVNRNIEIFQDLGIVEQDGSWPAEYTVNADSVVIEGFRQAKRSLLDQADRLHEDDVEQLEDKTEWIPLEELDDGEIQAVIAELERELSVSRPVMTDTGPVPETPVANRA
jgi:DNA-binding IclR family transcriptional regulator